MKKQVFRVGSDGFNGAWYPASSESGRGLILMLGDSAEDYMARSGAKWLNRQGIHVMAMSADKKDYGHHNYPLERFGKAISFMKAQRCNKLGVIGASTTGMMALLAASCYPELSLTIAISPPDFVMEGFYQDGRDGMRERPGDNESTVTWQGKPLPYLPYAYRHPEYWKKILEESSFYYFTRCPICEFCEREGIAELMPALCATDEVMFRLQHGKLFREHTIANGDGVCDYWVVGDQMGGAK